MSLESKAKTPYQVWNSAPTHSEPLYVTLEEAQKEISAFKVEFEKNNAFSYSRILELTAKVEAANKILDNAEHERLTGEHVIYWSDWQKLRACLSQENITEKK